MDRLFLLVISFFVSVSVCAGGLGSSDLQTQGTVPMQEAACFPGGMSARIAFLQKNLVYPSDCFANSIEGEVNVKYVVKKDGTLADFEIVKSSGNESLDNEALRVVRLFPKHTPSRVNGIPVESSLTLPVYFRLK